MSTDLVRVKHADTNHRYTVTRHKAETDPKLTIINVPAVDVNGQPLPATPHRPLSEVVNPKPTAPKEATK